MCILYSVYAEVSAAQWKGSDAQTTKNGVVTHRMSLVLLLRKQSKLALCSKVQKNDASGDLGSSMRTTPLLPPLS